MRVLLLRIPNLLPIGHILQNNWIPGHRLLRSLNYTYLSSGGGYQNKQRAVHYTVDEYVQSITNAVLRSGSSLMNKGFVD